jgi:hypothetical protein
MNVVDKVSNFNINNIFFLDKKKNIIIDGVFTKILYSLPNYSLLGLYFEFGINGTLTNNKFYCFDMNENSAKINEYIEMEKTLLKLYKSSNNVSKASIYTLKNHLNQGYLKVFTKKETRNKKYILKVSGIWETHSELGITYKLLECSYL